MKNSHLQDYLSKIQLLEERVGSKTTYEILEPNEIVLSDLFSLQRAAKLIAQFIGLRHLNFLVTPIKMSGTTAGQIELTHQGNDVYIEISNEQLSRPTAVLAILAHEISHKFLHFHNIKIGNELVHKYENEILTDITAMFLGLGKLMLNGCQIEEVTSSHNGSGTVRTTTSYYAGYLKRDQLAFIYLFLNTMRNIPKEIYMENLESDVRYTVGKIRADFCEYFDPSLHESSSLVELISDCKEAHQSHQRILMSIDKSLSEYMEIIYKPTRKYLKNEHKAILESQKQVHDISTSDSYDPCLQYMNRINAKSAIEDHLSLIKGRVEDTSTRHKDLVESKGIFKIKHQDKNDYNFHPTKCPIDGTDLPEPILDTHVVICPSCNYEITLPDIDKEPSKSRKSSLRNWLFNRLSE